MRTALCGINLGGWLLVERWMTPEVFAGVIGPAEIDIVRELGYEAAKTRLTHHRDTFITEEDFKWLKKRGFDFVRLPAGHWLFKETDDFVDGEVYLKRAFRWAKRHNLGVVLDFHGVPGSQNGLDHSGVVGKIRMYQSTNQQSALETLRYMAKTYGQEPALLGLELINEPKVRFFLGKLLRYYDQAYEVTAEYLRPEVKIIVSDAFMPRRMAKRLARRPYATRLVLDVHLYQVFSWWDKRKSLAGHLKTVERWQDLLDTLARYLPVMVGEWSAALPPQAYRNDPQDETVHVRHYYDKQVQAFDTAAWAHAYWSYKAPGCGVWSWRDAEDKLEP